MSDVATSLMISSIELYKNYRHMSGRSVYLLFREFGVFDVLKKHKDIESLLSDDDLLQDIDSILALRGGLKIETIPRN